MGSNSKLNTQNSKLAKLPGLLLDWFAANARDLPWRRTHDAYSVWVSEIMLQQTQVKTVIPYWNRWMAALPDIAAVAAAHPDTLHKLWEGLGYYTRVRNLQKAAQVMVARHGGKFPEKYEEILELPGIGRYTAGAVGSIAFNQPVPILDGNVIRVLTRVFGISENPKEKQTNERLWQLAGELVHTSSLILHPSPNPCSALNQSLMELGALVCTPRNAQCGVCPVRRHCVANAEDRVESLPNLGARPVTTARFFVALVAEHKGKFLVRQRPAGVVNAHLWEFPNVETTGDEAEPGLAARELLGAEPAQLHPLVTVKHSITRYRMTLSAYALSLRKVPAKAAGVWKTREEMNGLAFASAHKKILGKVTVSPAKG